MISIEMHIMREYFLGTAGVRYTRESQWITPNGLRHRLTGPADVQTGLRQHKESEDYWVMNKRHRSDGYAHRSWYPTGKPLSRVHFINDKSVPEEHWGEKMQEQVTSPAAALSQRATKRKVQVKWGAVVSALLKVFLFVGAAASIVGVLALYGFGMWGLIPTSILYLLTAGGFTIFHREGYIEHAPVVGALMVAGVGLTCVSVFRVDYVFTEVPSIPAVFTGGLLAFLIAFGACSIIVSVVPDYAISRLPPTPLLSVLLAVAVYPPVVEFILYKTMTVADDWAGALVLLSMSAIVSAAFVAILIEDRLRSIKSFIKKYVEVTEVEE